MSHSIRFFSRQVILIDAARLKPQRTIVDERSRLRHSIMKIRSLEGFQTIPIVFIPEDGPPGAGENLWEFVRDMTPITVMTHAGSSHYDQHRFGVPKTQETTMRMKDMTVTLIASGSLDFSERLFSLPHVDKGEDVDATLEKLHHQFLNYNALVKKKYAEYYNDDVLIALMQMICWADTFLKCKDTAPVYREFYRTYIMQR